MRKKHPELVHYLEGSVVDISGTSIPPYHWIGIHTTVEADHFKHALKGANLALRYYTGTQEKTKVKNQILGGISVFANLQEGFMEYLSSKK